MNNLASVDHWVKFLIETGLLFDLS